MSELSTHPTATLFVERRQTAPRRTETDLCANMPLDLYHRKRRKNKDRRTTERSKMEDIAAFYAGQSTALNDKLQ